MSPQAPTANAITPVSLVREHAVARALANCVVCAMTSSAECLDQLQPLLQHVMPSCRLSGYVLATEQFTNEHVSNF